MSILTVVDLDRTEELSSPSMCTVLGGTGSWGGFYDALCSVYDAFGMTEEWLDARDGYSANRCSTCQ